MTTSPKTVHVNLGDRSYDILVGSGNLDRVSACVDALGAVSHVVIITDENVQEPHAVRVAESLTDGSVEVDLLVVEPGEPTKSADMAAGLWDGLLQLGADRKTLVMAVGGGVIGDLAGFVAATYARGVRFFQVPTSLLAQVDSSVGGKVGINLPEAKNMVGAFKQPAGVLIDIATLETLPEREYRAGLAEVVKYGVILDAEFFDYLETNVEGLLKHDTDVLIHVVERCCRLKADVVEQDEREETGLRAVLNYGHTFAHPLETLPGYGQIVHGEAVAMGMLCASRLAERLGRINASMTERQRKLLEALGLPIELPVIDRDEMMTSMMHDKKVEHGKLRFVLPSRMGHVELVADIDPADVRAAMEN